MNPIPIQAARVAYQLGVKFRNRAIAIGVVETVVIEGLASLDCTAYKYSTINPILLTDV